MVLDQSVIAEDSLEDAIETADQRDRWIVLVDVEKTPADSGDGSKSVDVAVLFICKGLGQIPAALEDLPVLVIDSVEDRGPVALYLPGEIPAAGDVACLLARSPREVDAEDQGNLEMELEDDS